MLLSDQVELTSEGRAELQALVNSPDVTAAVATRARIVLWRAENRPKKEIAALAGVSRPTVDLWLARYGAEGMAGLLDRPRGAGREQVPAGIRARILAASKSSPPAETGLSHWSSREMAAFIERTEGTPRRTPIVGLQQIDRAGLHGRMAPRRGLGQSSPWSTAPRPP